MMLAQIIRSKSLQHGNENDCLLVMLIWPTWCTPPGILELYQFTSTDCTVAPSIQTLARAIFSTPSYPEKEVMSTSLALMKFLKTFNVSCMCSRKNDRYVITVCLVKFSVYNMLILLNDVSATVMYRSRIQL